MSESHIQVDDACVRLVQIRATFHLPDDLTDEEKLEPIKNLGEDPRIRLLNRLYAKRRKVRRPPPEAPDLLAWAAH